MCIMPGVCGIFNMGHIDGDTSGLLLRCIVNFIVILPFGQLPFGQHFGDGRCEGCFAVIDMANSTDVTMGLGSLKCFFLGIKSKWTSGE